LPAQQQTQRLLRLYDCLLACDHAIIGAPNRTTLFEEVCRTLVSPGDMQLAWIGMLNPGDQRIWPQAHAGEGWNYLEWIRLMSKVDQLPSLSLTHAALAQNQAQWSDDARHMPQTDGLPVTPQRTIWKSAAALPLCLGGVACGVLCIYDHSSHAFDAPVLRLLHKLAESISAGLDTLEQSEQRSQAEYALQESEVRYNALFASNCMPMLLVDPADGRIVDANIRAIDFYGWDFAAITSKLISDINVLSPAEIRAEMANAVSAKRSYFDFRHRLANGEVRNVEVFSSPLSFDGQTYLISAVHDITRRRKLEEQLHQSQSLLQHFIDQFPGTAFIKDSELRLLMANRHLGDDLGTEPAALIGKTAHDIFPTDFADFVTLLDRELLETGASRTTEETFQGRHNETTLFVIDDGTGQRFLGGLSMDCTERFRARERSTALLRINELGDQLPVAEFLAAGLALAERLTDSQQGLLYDVSEEQQTLQRVAWTVAGQPCGGGDNAPPCTLGQAALWAQCLQCKSPLIWPGEADQPRLAVVPIMEGNQVRMVLGVAGRDSDYGDFETESLLLLGNDLWRIARRARLELLQSEKMASIGQLASGVAHEINNPIGFVKSNLGTLGEYVEKLLDIVRAYEAVESLQGDAVAPALADIARRKQDMDFDFVVDDVKKLLDESHEGVQRVSRIVLDLKNFSRSGDQTMEAADLHLGIESTINMVWNQLKYKVQIVREYADLPPVVCVASQINQVVMNLLTNAGQAIDGQGSITVRTGTSGAWVWVEVQDSGCGMTPEQQARIFEPFYTTKPIGQGTGLGLSISFGIVQRHCGSISVQSATGAGSCFRVTLPIQPAKATT
jgi:PAS domain S-box-containing protein